jgi:hypothetical protein
MPVKDEDHPAQSEIVNLVQSVSFSILYILSGIVVGCFQVKSKTVEAGALKVLQSGWCVWVSNTRLLLVSTGLIAVAQIVVIYLNSDNLRFVRLEYNSAYSSNTLLQPEPMKKGSASGSDQTV